VWGGAADVVPAGVAKAPIPVLVPRNNERITAAISPEAPLQAPLQAGDVVGQVQILLGDQVLFERDLVALESVPQGGWIKRARDYLKLYFLGGQ